MRKPGRRFRSAPLWYVGHRWRGKLVEASSVASLGRSILDALPTIAFSARPDGTLALINRRWYAITGVAADASLDEAWRDTIAIEDSDRVGRRWIAAVSSGATYEDEFRVRMLDGTYHWFLARAEPIRDAATGRIEEWLGTCTDIDTQKRAENRLHTLVQAGFAISLTLDYEQTAHNVARVVVESFATLCILDVFDEQGRPHRTAVHRDLSRQTMTDEVRNFPPERARDNHPVRQALEDGRAAVVDHIDDVWIKSIAHSDKHARLLRALEIDSLITLPVRGSDQRIIGALTCFRTHGDGEQKYTADDLSFGEEMARRVGGALENARMYQRERRIAAMLQESSLPKRLPELPHLRISAEYQPGNAEARIGGDWYDAFALDDGRIMLTLGDVLGNGLQAAITMTKLRQAMQSAALLQPDPNAMLEVADKTLRLLDANAYATAIAAVFDPVSGTTMYASAGHPPPFLVDRNGRLHESTQSGLMLGLRTGERREKHAIAMQPGSTLILFTDGLIELTRNIEEGYQRLRDALSRPDVMNGPTPASAIVEAVLDGKRADDDIAVLTATVIPR